MYKRQDPKDPRYCETRALVVDEVVTGKQAPKDEDTQYSERADLGPTEDNLLILGESGDVLEALTRVPELREKYLGKVKCIYIDPPFNTAQTFANYEDNLEHSVWLTMMRDRLVHLRKLLSDDGSIWVHLDDVENHRMRVLMDEVFGSGNFVAEVVWQKAYSPRNDASGFSVDQDVIIVYSKAPGWQSNKLPRLASRDALYTSPDGDSRVWISDNPAAPHSVDKNGRQVSAVYGVQNPVTGEMIYPAKNRQWGKKRADFHEWLNKTTLYRDETNPDLDKRSRATGISVNQLRSDVPDLVVDGPLLRVPDGESLYGSSPLPRLYFTDGGRGGLKLKRYLDEISQTRAPQTLWLHEEVGHNRTSKAEMNALFPETAAFATPKPERLLERIIHIATNPGDVVFDVFAGSGTTAAVAQKMGRRWVTCELVEDTFTRFTRPRLEKVVNGEDQGGISIQKPERVDATDEGLPEGLSPEDAQKFNSALNKVLAANPEWKTEAVVKALKTATKTKNQNGVVNWRGGGGFTVAHLAPQCFDYVPELGLVTLTEAATGATLVNSVAANLNFSLTPDNRHFDGKRGSMFLKVVEGRLDKDKVEELLTHLDNGEGVTLAATELEPGIRQFARTTDKPCQIVHIPNDIFTYSATQEGK